MKRNIGIFLGIAPNYLKYNQGIVQLLCHLLSSEEFRKRIVIAMPSWNRHEFKTLLKDAQKIKYTDIEFIFAKKRRSFFFFLISKFGETKKKCNFSFLKNLFKALSNFIKNCMIQLAARNFIFFVLILFPFICLYFLYQGLQLVYAKIFNEFFVRLKLWLKAWKSDQLSKLKSRDFIRRIYQTAQENELSQLIRRINRKKEIDVWYIPTGFWPQTREIKANKVIAIHDIVFCDFPSLFCDASVEYVYRRIQNTLTIEAEFLCYSEYVKSQHLVSHQVNKNKISIIKHGYTDLSCVLKMDDANPRNRAISILETFQKEFLKHDLYLCDFHLSSMKFIFYSSQVRPHKNILNLVKAYHILLRKRFVNIKLIITGDIKKDKNLHSYIYDNRLQYDVISFFGVSIEVLAALNYLAICAVNPSLFEGGFPFTFCEAYSVGTPSIMSRIPVVLEELQDEELNARMLFDPHSVNDMTDKIEWAIHNKAKLFQLQKPLYDKFASRSWKHVAKEYLNLFDEIAIKKLDQSISDTIKSRTNVSSSQF
jgi:glycosyltransferase involved in cell wall biosynthesis